MKIMPASKRGDFVYFDSPEHIVSNRRDLAADLTIKRVNQSVVASQSRARRSYPPPRFPGTGPYSRMYSKQGITGAVGYVSIPCNAQRLVAPDEGFTYFESVDTLDHKTEGGLEHIPGSVGGDGVIRPYFSDGTFQPLHNTFTYSCNDGPIGIMKGHLPAPSSQTFVLTGVPAQRPSQTYLDPNAVRWDKAVWNFFNDGGNYGPAGTDASGLGTPCTTCYVEKMTTIAQHGLRADGSYFGVYYDPQTGRGYLAIHWEQVEFGEIALPCNGQVNNQPGTGTCSLRFQADSSRWLGDFQAYPDSGVSQEKSNNVLSPDPYETYVAIDMRNYQQQSVNRDPMGAFTDPHPYVYQPPCTLDAMGYCAVQYPPNNESTYCTSGDSTTYYYIRTTVDYDVFDAYGQRQPSFYYVTTDSYAPCEVTGWIGWSPAQYYNDYYLPQ